MSAILFRRPVARVVLLAGALSACPALAGDKPATPEGAQNLLSFFSKYLPAAPAGGAPFVTVEPNGANYLVSANLSALNGLIRTAGEAAYDPATLIYKLTEQEDGKWRLDQDSFPKLVSHAEDVTSAVEITNYRQTVLIDPALAWFVSGSASADKGVITVQTAKSDQAFDFSALKADYATTVNADGTVSSAVKEEINDVALRIAALEAGKSQVNVDGRVERAAFNFGVDGLRSRKVLDLWGLLVAHRDDLAEHEAELKDLLKQFAAPGLKIAEGAEASKALIAAPQGAIALSDFKAAIRVANAGPQSAIDATIAAGGLSLPVGLAPPGAADLTPTKIDLAATFRGIDIAAAANEAIADMHLGGPGPAISDADSAKVVEALLSAGPLTLEFAPSHVIAPAIDADFQGVIHYEVGKPSGRLTIRMRNFDKTMAALKGLGPDIERQAIPGVAMAKGLAKTESDGSLSWLIELGQDRSIKVNGIPLGKAPP